MPHHASGLSIASVEPSRPRAPGSAPAQSAASREISPVTPPGLSGYSRALYSNWLWHQPFQLLVDAGEGLPLALGANVFSVAVIAITHGHSDHLLGLPGFAAARRFGKGAPERRYAVLYPRGSAGVETIRDTIVNLWRGVEFPIAWTPVQGGDRVAVSATRQLEAFSVEHVTPEPALGYRVVEFRRRLKPEFAARSQQELRHIAERQGRGHLTERYEHVLFVHSGDAMPIDRIHTQNADVLVHDATFLEPGDRRDPIHASASEVFDLASAANVQTLILTHLSIRYDRPAAIARLRQQLAASGFAGGAWLLDEANFVNLR